MKNLFYITLLFISSLSCMPKNKVDTSSFYPDKTMQVRYHTEWTANHYKERIAVFKATPLAHKDIVFLGNSITEKGGDWGAKFGLPNIKNRGISGDVTDGFLLRLGEIAYYKPSKVFIMIGVNDLFNLHYQKQIPSAEYVANNILKIVDQMHEVSPTTEIYVESILPDHQDFMAPLINKVNTIVMEHDGKKFTYINLNPLFQDKKGLMNNKLSTDGTHLNEDGYAIWVDAIKEIVKN
ncbi:GDSL-type esterase/lipase family protein [Flammeovirga kamogawensis]|uniref:SGNH hydrolase-type esterase domain-containing protein n=1 Tax=Flammeovirga kamogawensis TaxID=373891 RepID=A0ABX8H2H3_9BACT|nr:GDSL-type esterase/lipase family protein [Flammeovirga kamogawensis]MBB6460295.1 lysophospholipase L1-like esterase [Flammeovirga kamogawensis]QWG10105.1 hypothetical protein KM029_20700 [Flammeovirga kamogawensis]TRX65612.1 GDSL family lipase [Flammeovirga kamogawensis]